MKIVSLFSGAGGMDLGLKISGHDIIWANDVFEDAVKTYEANLGRHITQVDICDVKSQDIPECDVVVGGFPCQGFSVANWGRTVSDPRNQLYREMVRVVRDKKPRFFICENVKGLASLGGGQVLAKIIEDFEALDYKVKYKVVNAADYGVPQSRMRLIIFGTHKEEKAHVEFPPVPTHANPAIAEQVNLPMWKSVGEALAHFPEPSAIGEVPNHQCSKYKLRFNGHLGHRFIEPQKPAPTVTARGDDKGGVVVLHHPSNKRRMTAREMAAVQSFPDNFVFIGTKTSAYRQIANAVPVLLGKAIGDMLAKADDKLSQKRQKGIKR
jgi:DNA (cytosine-5)-methyltransferase 1